MMKQKVPQSILISFGIAALWSCAQGDQARDNDADVIDRLSKSEPVEVETAIGPLTLDPPYKTASARNQSKMVKWKDDATPVAPEGFVVTRYADELKHPRRTYVGKNGDVFVVESNTRGSADRITLLRDQDGNGRPDEKGVYLEGLKQPYGMLILDGYFYVANTDSLMRYPYKEGVARIEAKGEKILDLPAGGYNNHWTRNLIASKDGKKIYVTVGSASNVGEYGMEREKRRAAILEINPDGSDERIYASGLRNPVGVDWNPGTGELWSVINERDELGDNLVPDYLTSVREDGWYGWPYSYYGQIKDPRWSHSPHQDLVDKAIIPDVPLGNHTASLGLAFHSGKGLPEKYAGGAFVGQHGSWNRSKLSGYKVVFVPFDDEGKPQQPEDFLTGFIADPEKNTVYGRPVGISVLPDGSILVCDDDAGIIWRVAAK
ncbi:PQQ-dependent sugar dehydrogenase [Haloferula chungangensis]|uniref:PQQ-dependent sugar dehydrogenase n=1 Tax=Haloferula chungangensis TaxID=1048331 RepID=A0ABW2LEZ5_9BACT